MDDVTRGIEKFIGDRAYGHNDDRAALDVLQPGVICRRGDGITRFAGCPVGRRGEMAGWATFPTGSPEACASRMASRA